MRFVTVAGGEFTMGWGDGHPAERPPHRVWVGAFGIHVLAYLARVPGLVAADWGRRGGSPGGALRYGLLALALVLGVTLAIAVLPEAGSWLHGGHER